MKIKCECGREINPASLMGKMRFAKMSKKERSDYAKKLVEARKRKLSTVA